MNNIEKENEQLKKAAKLSADASFKLSEQVYNLKAKNERLKFVISEIKEIAENLYYRAIKDPVRRAEKYIT